MMRIYLPATLNGLRELHTAGAYAAGRAHAVTPGLREWYTDGDIEDLEYVAFTRAAQDALGLLRADTTAPRRRVVISADVDDGLASRAPGGLGDSAITLEDPVRLSGVAAIHVDGTDAETDVTVAVGALAGAVGGDEDLQFLVDSVEDHALEWYDPTELEQLLKS